MFRIAIYLIALSCVSGCAGLTAELSEEMAPSIGTNVAAQVGTEVAVQVGTAMAGQSKPAPASVDAPEEITELPYDCANKTCGQMTSCEEAVYKLTVCNHRSRDANNDGVPCESLCRGADVPAIAARFAGIAPTLIPTSPPGSGDMARVTRVIDGDTIEVLLNGKPERIRYLQLNTPERDEPCFAESTRANEDLVAGKTVRLVADTELVDRYDRLLRFIYVGEVLVNRVLVEQGYAEVVLYPPNDMHYEEFKQLETEAAEARRGCHPTGVFADGSYTR